MTLCPEGNHCAHLDSALNKNKTHCAILPAKAFIVCPSARVAVSVSCCSWACCHPSMCSLRFFSVVLFLSAVYSPAEHQKS